MPLARKALSRLKGRVHSVALVGMDGSGKSTQADLLGSGLAELNKRVVLIHPFGKKLLSFLPDSPQQTAPALGYGSGRPRAARLLAAGLEILDVAAYIWAAYVRCFGLALSGEREVWLVSDRSFDDLLIKYRHLGAFSPAALGRLRRLVPCAEETIWLQTEPEVAMRRDREFEPHYYQELHADYKAAARAYQWQIVSTTNRPREAIATDIAKLLSLRPAPAPAAPASTKPEGLSATPGA